MKGNFRNSYMNDAEIENVSGGSISEWSTTKKVIAGVAAVGIAALAAYGTGVAYEKIKYKEGWGHAFKHPWNLGKGKGPGEPEKEGQKT